jgi:4-amino-4-deoxy-L-arabinose transferase-like glycosyltransferase
LGSFGFYLGVMGLIFAVVLGAAIILSIKKDDTGQVAFYILLIFGVMPQAVYNIPEQIRRPFLIVSLAYAAALSFFIAGYYAKKDKRAASLGFTAGAIIIGSLGILSIFGVII